MDRGAWRATVHRVAKSWTRLTSNNNSPSGIIPQPVSVGRRAEIMETAAAVVLCVQYVPEVTRALQCKGSEQLRCPVKGVGLDDL